MHYPFKHFLVPLLLFVGNEMLASEVDDLVRTVYLYGDYGLGTYKSTLMVSNDTNSVVTYGVGTYAGQEKRLGVEYRVETATTGFALNTSSLQMIWSTTIIKYRLWAFELGPVIGGVKATGNRAGTDVFDAVGSGYGGYFGMTLPIGKNNSLDIKATQVSTGEVIDKKLAAVAIGPRLDIEIGGRIGLTRKSLAATLGYRRRSNTITESGTSYAELQTATFIGFNSGFDF
ncbi:MAG: hypothetical protein NTV34_04520 [Proteobacteria bacterium]|nr:hypothetical protein [Pseudomonadota bacterium]